MTKQFESTDEPVFHSYGGVRLTSCLPQTCFQIPTLHVPHFGSSSAVDIQLPNMPLLPYYPFLPNFYP
uniref:Uncharacterized protein n=1 Tax=Rhizophora mucronata TaxID=61149 RepID=A0A2P2P8J7_RHIMU